MVANHLDARRLVCSTRRVGLQWLRFRTDLRTRWRVMAALVLLVALAGGAALAAAEGARRTASVIDRLRSVSHVPDVGLNPVADTSPDQWAKVAQLPQVVRSVHMVGTIGARVLDDGSLDTRWLGSAQVVATDPEYGRTIDRPRMIEGRLADHPDEAVVNRKAAAMLGLHVGDHFPVRWYDVSVASGTTLPTADQGVAGDVTISGIMLTFDDALKDPDDATLIQLRLVSRAVQFVP